ncbi:splicing factor 3B subunit 1 [Dorcoceras hygrometricum]|uniref:Splicing factor 3B subunit 1 n=1 Tax=Dorcoceras hygrometricum TaxID=472368 RepID=A0A2Z7AGK7_9LAMI|nr:splicing factor 3B subunit 1 [Dorcoceras hygrometricum]
MKFEYRLLNDILAKTVTVKAGSFDAVTHERFLMMSAIHGGVKVNWGRLLFNIFKDMVTPASMVESRRPAASKRRPAPTVGEPVAMKKRTTVRRAAPTDKNLALVNLAQDVEPISIVPAVTPRASRHRAPKRKLVLQTGFDDDIVDSIIHQVIADTTVIETEEPAVEEPGVTRSAELEMEQSFAVNDEDDNLYGSENETARKIASFAAPKQFLKEPLRSGADNQDRASRVHTEIFRKEEHYITLRDNLAELIAFFNRGCDDKKGEVDSSQGRGPPPPDDRARPGGGGGSRSEPVKRRGSGSQSGPRRRGFRYWLSGE